VYEKCRGNLFYKVTAAVKQLNMVLSPMQQCHQRHNPLTGRLSVTTYKVLASGDNICDRVWKSKIRRASKKGPTRRSSVSVFDLENNLEL